MVSAVDICKRTLVKLIHTLASAYGCCVTLTRESSDADVKKAFRKVSKKTHPDHGGSTADQQRLNAAYEEWCQALRDRGSRGRPRTEDSSQVVLSAAPGAGAKAFKFRSQAVLLTYQGLSAVLEEALQQWCRFVSFVQGSLRTWGVTRWTVTLETNENGNGNRSLG